MNANELADMAENACCAYQKEIATMLRQQQAEIEMLRQGMKDGFDGLETMTAFSKAQADQITKLKLEWQYMYDRANMESTNEPVAWIGKPELQFGFTDTRVTNEKESWDDIPLYTHPVKEQEPDLYSEDGFPLWTTPQLKELTDEEIEDLAAYAGENPTKYDMIDFARAIMKRCGIISGTDK